jgi:hypothetical protein
MSTELSQTISADELLFRARSWTVLEAQLQGLLERTIDRQRTHAPNLKDDSFPQNARYRRMLEEINGHREFAMFRAGLGLPPLDVKKYQDATTNQRFQALSKEVKEALQAEQALFKRFGDGKLDLKRDLFGPLLLGLSNIPNVLGLGANILMAGEEAKREIDTGELSVGTAMQAAAVGLAALFGRKRLRSFNSYSSFAIASENLQFRVLAIETQAHKIGKMIHTMELAPEMKAAFGKELKVAYEALEAALQGRDLSAIHPASNKMSGAFVKIWDELSMKRGRTKAENLLLKAVTDGLAELDRFT